MSAALARVPMQLTRGCLVASVQVDLDEPTLAALREDVLERVREKGVRGVVVDVSAVAVIDGDDFESLRLTLEMAAVMGATPVIVGLRPGVVAALVDVGARTAGVLTALDVDHAFELIGAA